MTEFEEIKQAIIELNRYENKLVYDIKFKQQDLERLEQLKQALDKACERLGWDCPVSQDLIDDLDCENRCSSDFNDCCKECWKIYFSKEVLE